MAVAIAKSVSPDPLPGYEKTPQDLTSEGLFEDIDGEFDVFDVQGLFNRLAQWEAVGD